MDRLPAPQRSYSLSPELSVRPTTDELDRPEAISPAIDPPSRHVEGTVTRKGQLQSEVGPPWTRASARYSRCRRRARRPGQRRSACPQGYLARAAHQTPLTSRKRPVNSKGTTYAPTWSTRRSWPDRSSSTPAACLESEQRPIHGGAGPRKLCTRRTRAGADSPMQSRTDTGLGIITEHAELEPRR